MKLKTLLNENEMYFFDDEAEEEFNDLKIINRIPRAELKNLQFVGDVIAGEDTYRPGAVYLKIYVNDNNNVVVHDDLNDDPEADVMAITPKDLDKYFD